MYNLKSPYLTRHLKNNGCVSNRSASKTRQLGASIMELMVGITIGLLVVIAALGSLVYTHVASTTMVDATRLQQKADAAFRLISFQILQAGAVELVPDSFADVVRFSIDYEGFNKSATGLASTVSVHGIDGNGSTIQDTLRISYQDNGTVRDCLGQTTATPSRVDNQFSFSAATNELQCTGAAAGSIAQPILDGVEDFQVTYGVVTATGFQFFTANNVTDWTNIQAVAICLQLRGDTQSNPQPGMLTIASCVAGTTVPNDGRLRRVFNRTFSLRNALL